VPAIIFCLVVAAIGVFLIAAPRVRRYVTKPDFTAEFEDERRLHNEYVRDDDHNAQIEAWIAAVHDKLFAWSPKAAREFRPVKVPATPESLQRMNSGYAGAVRHIQQVTEQFAPMPKPEPALQRLKTHADRLAEIVDPGHK
jgi:hypothetical protein